MLKNGMFIQNRYEIISKIGSGGMADVYKARDHKLNRFVAVKVLKKEFRDDKAFIAKFAVEAQSAAGLAHANIVSVYDVGEEAGISFIVMELVEGITLKDYIRDKGHLPVREATSIALKISAGLEAAHNNGIIHRDIKPQNIIISMEGQVKVADFGIARAVNTTTSSTINSLVMGSVHYSSPEQVRGGYSDVKSDIYSLGITMYEMLTGKVPFDGDTTVAVALQHMQEEIRPPKELMPEIPHSTNQIVLKCTQKSPDRRYSNMTELIRDLRESLVNPEGDFVVQKYPDIISKTLVIQKSDREKLGGKQPVYDEQINLGAAAELNAQEEPVKTRAYQPGSYYQNSAYQDVSSVGGDLKNTEQKEPDAASSISKEAFDLKKDASENPDAYAVKNRDGQYQSYQETKDFISREEQREFDDEISLNPRLEKIVTIGGIIAAAAVGCVFLALLANAFGIFRKSTNMSSSVVQPNTEAITEVQQQAAAVSVPSLLGKTEEEAQSLLQSSGLTGKNLGETESSEYNAGEICYQSPAAGMEVADGSEVTYQVTAQEAVVTITLQDLTTQTQEAAESYLTGQGLLYTVDTSRTSDTVTAGCVIATEPAAGSTLNAGDTVILYVQPTPQTEAVYVTMRNLYYYSKEVATEALEQLGLNVAYEYEPSSDVTVGWVTRQSVAAGEQVAQGSTVTLYISTGASGESTVQDTGDTTSGSVWKCDASLLAPTGYSGQQVRITLVQEGQETLIEEGTVEFPYHLQIEGASGVSEGTVYIYLLDDQGNVSSTVRYTGITFTEQ